MRTLYFVPCYIYMYLKNTLSERRKQHMYTYLPMGLSSDFTSLHKKGKEIANEPGKRVCGTFPFGQAPTCNSLTVRKYELGREDHEFDSKLGNVLPSKWLELNLTKYHLLQTLYIG